MMRGWWASLVAICAAGPALGQDNPRVVRWTLPGISSEMWESHPAIDPKTGDLWWVRSDQKFSGWRILTSRCEGGSWSKPQPMPIAATGLEADPWFSADGQTLWFISTRSTGAMKSAALDIWRAQRDENGAWSSAERLPEPVNSSSAEWFPRPAKDGWLYFGSARPGGLGQDDIWRARQTPIGKWIVENAGPDVNTTDSEYEFLPSRDGTWGILATDKGMYRMVPTAKGWRRAGKFGAEVNVNGTEIGPMLAPDGHSFVFSRDTGDKASGELFIASFGAAKGNASLQGLCAARAN